MQCDMVEHTQFCIVCGVHIVLHEPPVVVSNSPVLYMQELRASGVRHAMLSGVFIDIAIGNIRQDTGKPNKR